MTKIRWTEPAVDDLRAIRNHIVQDSQEAAISLVKKIIMAPERLTVSKNGTVVLESETPNVRELIVERNYRVERNRVAVEEEKSWGKMSAD